MPDTAPSNWYRDPWRVAVVALSGVLLVAVGALIISSKASSDDPGAIPGTTSVEGSTTTTKASPTTDTTRPGATTTPQSGDPGTAILPTNGLVAVKIDNAPGARPQVGIADLPLLVEYPVEGGLTRMIAIVEDQQSGHIGPVRSLRPVDADLLSLFAPIAVSTGGQPFVAQSVEATGVVGVTPGALGVFDLGERPSPHNFFLNIDSLLPRLGDYQPRVGGLPNGVVPQGTNATVVNLSIAGIGFNYSGNAYRRTQDGAPYQVLDSLSGGASVLEHDTLVFLFASQRSAGYFDSNGAEVPTFDVIGGGDLMVFSGGSQVDGTWSRVGYDEAYQFADSTGHEFGIPEGRVYLAVVPRETAVSHEP